MARGGGRGRGGGVGRGRGGKIRGGDGEEIDIGRNVKPRPWFPNIAIPTRQSTSRAEKLSVARYRAMRKSLHSGPFFTVYEKSNRTTKVAATRAARINPFESMPSYSAKYKPKTQELPNFKTRKYNLNFFPEELRRIVDPKHKPATAQQSARNKRNGQTADDVPDEEGDDGDDLDDEALHEDDEALSVGNPEDDFSDDDLSMGEDYNAEGYFETGEDDIDQARDRDEAEHGGTYDD